MAAKHCSERIVVRILHVFLTSSVVLILFLKDTELNKACIDGEWGLVIGYSSLCFLSLVTYFIASCMNPGYVSLDTETMIMVAYEKNQDEETSETSNEISENCHVVSTPLPFGTKLRRCGYCAIIQPLRSKHCEDCGRCVHRYDHHCPWLGSCVGEKNHRFFWLFLFLECCLIAWSIRIASMAFKHKSTWGQWALTNVLLIVAMFILCVGILVVFLLLSCHSYLMVTGQTTWEYMSRSRISYLKIFEEGDNPFHEGMCGNIYKFFCYFKPRRWEILLRKREDCA